MNMKTRTGKLRRALVVGGLTLIVPLALALPAEATSSNAAAGISRGGCTDGSRAINVSSPRDIARATLSGSQGRSEITLRSNPEGSCHWALISGYGQVWLERSSVYGGIYDGYVNPRNNSRAGITHTAATVTTEHYVRACGLPFIGEVTGGSGWEIGASVEGRSGGLTIGYNSDHQTVYQYGNGVVCTAWHSPDMFVPNSF